MARANSQLVHSAKGQDLSLGPGQDLKRIARKRLPQRDASYVESEVRKARRTSRFLVQVAKVEPPTSWLAAAMLADQPVEPALDPPGQREVRAIDREHQARIEYAGVEPIGK